MFDGFFEKNPPIRTETADKELIHSIKAAVLKSIEENPTETDLDLCTESEVTPMKKSNIARTFVIAAAAAVLGTASLVSAEAITERSANECVSDEKITDGKTEVFEVVAIDENGEEHFIARDRIEWIENENGTFDIFYDMEPEQMEKFKEIFDSIEPSSTEEIFKNADDLKKADVEWEEFMYFEF